mgnify:FL=1
MAQTVMVTGADGFIGSHLTEELVKKGEKVKAFCYYNSFGKWGWLDTLPQDIKNEIEVFMGDIRDPNGVRTAMKGQDVVYHLAALIAIPFSYHSPDSYVDTNIKGLLYCTRAALPGMVERHSGHVVNLGSIAGTYAYPGSNVYGASKGFVLQFSRGLRCDLHGTGVRVTDVEPGLLESEFSNVRFKGDESRFDTLYENAHPLRPEDIADTIWWVVSRPAHVNVSQVEVMPTTQSLASARVFKG